MSAGHRRAEEIASGRTAVEFRAGERAVAVEGEVDAEVGTAVRGDEDLAEDLCRD